MSDELKPCPFCGELLIPTQSGDGYTHNRRVRNANDCVLSWVVIRSPHHVAWNTRADLPATNAQIKANPNVKALVEAASNLNRYANAAWLRMPDNQIALELMTALDKMEGTLAALEADT